MNYWLIKSEPFKYSWEQFLKDKQTFWDGVRNYAARNNLRAMKKGDLALWYHSNEGLEIVGITIKADKRLQNMAVVRLGRLSVQPVTAEEYAIVMDLAGMK